MDILIELLIQHPLLLLFLVSVIGYYLGKIRFGGAGVAAVLFVGLAFGALNARISLPPELVSLGLVLFVYSIGLASGPGFFASFSRSGLRDNMMVAAVLLIAAAIVAAEAAALHLKPTIAAGLYTGALTNTPALAQVLNYVTHSSLAQASPSAATEPVVGYSVAYPLGVLGPILAILWMQRVWRIDYKRDAEQVRDMFPVEQEIYSRTVRVATPAVIGASLRNLSRQRGWRVVFGRVKHGDKVELAIDDCTLHEGDLVGVIGTPEEVDRVVRELGELATEQLDVDRSVYDVRRVFVSNPDLAGRKLADLDLPHRFGAIVTRVRRGDIELLAHGDLVLELGDRVRFVAPRDQMRATRCARSDARDQSVFWRFVQATERDSSGHAGPWSGAGVAGRHDPDLAARRHSVQAG